MELCAPSSSISTRWPKTAVVSISHSNRRPDESARAPAATASIRRAEFELGGLLKFHRVSLCGRLYPLPRRTTFRFRNALHLVEARNRVAYVRGIFQRLLALLRKREPGCGYPITSWFGQLCHYFSPSGVPCVGAAPDSLSRSTKQVFQLLPRGLVDVFSPRGFGHARLIHFLFCPSARHCV